MSSTSPDRRSFIGRSLTEAPQSLQRIAERGIDPVHYWIGPDDAVALSPKDQEAYELARGMMIRLAIEAPLKHASGHPGGPLSAFTSCYEVMRRRDPSVDESLRMSPGHLSLLGFLLQYLFGRDGGDMRLSSPQAICDTFRTIDGLPGHIEAGIGDIPFGTGPLGKGVSNALGVAFGKKYLGKKGITDVLLADGDSQEGQVLEAFRLAPALGLDHLVVHGDWNDMQLSGLPSKLFCTDLASMAVTMGWAVIEVQNGNDIAQVRAAQDKADTLIGKGKPIFICYYTTMGSGVSLMEEGSNTGKKNFHGAPLSKEEASIALEGLNLPSLAELAASYEDYRSSYKKAFDRARKTRTSSVLPFTLAPSYQRVVTEKPGAARKDFGAVHLKALMTVDPRIIVLHADLADSGGFGVVEKAFPDRVINVGVAEANMYMMAAGMRQVGLLPVTYTFASFGTNEARANARLIDINTGHIPLGVLHDCTHSGLSVGEDGETHQDRNYLNLPFDYTRVWVPGDSNQAGAMAEEGMRIIAEGRESIYVFSARSNHPQILRADGTPFYDSSYQFDGTASIVRGHGDTRDEATILSYGVTLHEAIKAADILAGQQRTVRVLNMASIRPIDASAVLRAALETQHLIVVEDHNTEGGLASQVADLISDCALPCTLRRLGVRHYFPSGKAEDLVLLAGLDASSIVDAVLSEFTLRLAGGEEALVACLYGLPTRLTNTRFVQTLYPFLAQISPSYLSTLRELWKSREFDRTKLPKNDDLIKGLRECHVDSTVNPLTGMPRSPQHDPGIM